MSGPDPEIEVATEPHRLRTVADVDALSDEDLARRFQYGRTYLHHACHGEGVPVVPALLARGCSATATDERNVSSLHDLCGSVHPSVSSAQRRVAFDDLLARGADVHAADDWGRTVLARAVAALNVDLAIALLARGVAPDVADRGGSTPLHHAARLGHQELVTLLVERGADPHHADERGDTILHIAARSWDPAWVRFVMDLGVDVHAVNASGQLPVDGSHEGANPACAPEDMQGMNAVAALLRERMRERATAGRGG